MKNVMQNFKEMNFLKNCKSFQRISLVLDTSESINYWALNLLLGYGRAQPKQVHMIASVDGHF